MEQNSLKAARIALNMAMSNRDEEKRLKEQYKKQKIKVAAVDYGGEFNGAITKIIERAVVAATREGVIEDTHVYRGALIGAVHEAVTQILPKAMGLNIGGKVGIARLGEHMSVAVFFGIGLINLNDVAIGLSHRSVPGN